MEILIFVGRVLFAMIFIGAGVGHLMDKEGTAAAARTRGFKNPELGVVISGVAMLVMGWCVVLGIFMDVALLGIAGTVLFLAFTMHPFWKDPEDKKIVEMSLFMKNLSIAGAALALFGFVAGLGYNSMSITSPLLGP